MSIEIPELPAKFDWWSVKSMLTEWFFRLQRSQGFVPPGAMMEFGGTVAPDGWVLCDGAEYNQNKYPNLYGVLGTFYGGAATTFNVPTATAVEGRVWIIKV